MAKVIRTLAAENGMDMGNICSFRTKNYVGIWNGNSDCFMVIAREDFEFCPIRISDLVSKGDSLQALDDAVYEKTEEHIEEVFDSCKYRLVLTDVEGE